MKLKTFAKRAAAAGAVAAALVLTALPALAAPAVDVDAKNPVADHANILSADTEEYIYAISSQLSDACGAQIGVYTVEEFNPDPFLDALDKYGLPRSENHDPVLVD